MYLSVASSIDLSESFSFFFLQEKKAKSLTEELFSKLDKTAKKNSINVDFKIIESDSITKALISFAKSKKIDLIVMGSSGRGGFDKVLLGSVSSGVMQKAKCPVLIIK